MSVVDRREKSFSLPSRTKQAFKQECDINHIMARFKRVQGAEFLTQYNGYVGGQFGDFSQIPDYRTALEQVRAAEGVFGALPAIVRKRFGNDPAEFLDFCQNPENESELVRLGLATPKAEASASVVSEVAHLPT